jgi:hypothetical protein
MIKQVFSIDSYWKVIAYYDLDYNFFDDVAWELKMASIPRTAIEEVWNTLRADRAKAVTCNSFERHISIVIFNPHTSKSDYINSIVHEAEHVKQAMFKVYNIEDDGEPPAYTIGYIVMRMYEIFRNILNK